MRPVAMIEELGAEVLIDRERRGWDLRAQAYHAFHEPISARMLGRLLDSVWTAYGTRVLDAGCGPGYLAARAAERGAEISALDISSGMLDLAHRLHPRLVFQQADAERLPHPANSFDAVAANLLLQHLVNPPWALEEFHRVLSPGGRLGMTAWDSGRRNRLHGLFLEALAAAGAGPAAFPRPAPPAPASDAAYLAMLKVAGFERIAIEPIQFMQLFASADDLWRGMIASDPRLGAAVEGWTGAVQDAARAHFDTLLEPHRTPDGLMIPASAKLLHATKP